MESKRGALIVLGILLVLAVALLIFGATRGGQSGPDFKATLASWKTGLLARLAKSQGLAPTELTPNPFKPTGECTLPGAAHLQCDVAKSTRAVRSATIELAGPGAVDVKLVALREGQDLECHKTLHRTKAATATTTSDEEKGATINLAVFEKGGTLTITNEGALGSSVLLRWQVK
jgi:hypothetical protein